MKPATLAAAVVAAALVLVSCTPGGDPSPTEPAASGDAVLESREVLGDPMLQMAEDMIAVSEGIDAARHRLQRGDPMLDGVDQLSEQLGELRMSIATAERAAAQAPVESAAAIVEEAAATARAGARAAAGEITFLRAAGAIDAALLDAALAWDRPGSQSEIRERLDALARQVGALRRRAAALRPRPAGCTAMRSNRREWVETVRSRTLELQAQANSAGGSEYDRLRASYRALPLAVEPRTADRADRACWLESSPVATAAPAMRQAVEELRQSLSG